MEDMDVVKKNAKNSSRYHMFKGIVEDNVIRFYIL